MKKMFLLMLVVLLSCKRSGADLNANNISFNVNNDVPVVNLKINGKTAKVLVDTGASISILDIDFKSKYNFSIYKSNEVVSGIGGQTNLYQVRDIKITINDSIVSNSFKGSVLSKALKDRGIVGIIGSDYFIKNQSIINFNNSIITNKK